MSLCPKCGNEVGDWAFCNKCGASIKTICQNCGAENAPNSNFCFKCGNPTNAANNAPSNAKANIANSNWTPKTMDDMYFAAIEGDVNKLREILQHQPELLREEYETVDDDGDTVKATAVFSILVHMNSNSMNNFVLDTLCQFGVDFNQTVRIYYRNNTKTVKPLLVYTIDWDNYPLTLYLLEHGANPNAFSEDDTESSMPTRLSMLYFAIDTHNNYRMVELLLKYGANPQMYCEPFINDAMVYQKIPPIYYSVVKNPSVEMTALLLQFGASTSQTIDIGRGFRHAGKFWAYVKGSYPNCSQVIREAEAVAKNLPTPKVKYVYANMYRGNQNQANAVRQANSAQAAIENSFK